MDPTSIFGFSAFFIVLGLLISFLYFYLKGEDRRDLPPPPPIVHLDTDEGRKLELEYNTFNKNVDSRGEQTLLAGAIILAASYLIVIAAFNLKGWLLLAAVLGAIISYATWLLAYATTET